jgi:hypothetical protein
LGLADWGLGVVRAAQFERNSVEVHNERGILIPMTKENLHSAIESNRAFVISMADGKEYAVPHRDFISFTRKGTAVIVSTEDDRVHILPLITMTGISQDSSVDAR